MTPTDKFRVLFRGNERSFGRCSIDSTLWTDKRAPTQEDFEKHIRGEMGIGIVPIMDDDTCYFGAIDIDAHGANESIDLAELDKRISDERLPIVACRSKSGGAHCYLFTKNKTPASTIRNILAMFSEIVGYPGSEIFPKQNTMKVHGTDELLMGNWINLCYMGGDNTNRYALVGGVQLDFESFLRHAKSIRLSDEEVSDYLIKHHPDAPPCIQRLINHGTKEGTRNEAMYNITVYLKKSQPDTYRETARAINSKIFDEPLDKKEVNKVIESASRRDYFYKCNEAPICDLCDKDTCRTRKFGVGNGGGESGSAIKFSDLKKFILSPVRWEILVDNKPMIVDTPTLMDYRKMRCAIMDCLTKLAAPMKNDQWHKILQPLLEDARIIEAPDDASTGGLLREHLREFIKKADFEEDDDKDRTSLLRGVPVTVTGTDGVRRVHFRGKDFINYLRKTKNEELRGPNMWIEIRKAGVAHNKVRVGDSVIRTWCIEIDEHNDAVLPPVEYESEF